MDDKFDELVYGSVEQAAKIRELEKTLSEMLCRNIHENRWPTINMYSLYFQNNGQIYFSIDKSRVCCNDFENELESGFQKAASHIFTSTSSESK